MVQYIISSASIWLVSLVLFDLFLKKENYHDYNRFFLLFTLLLGGVLPLLLPVSINYVSNFDRVLNSNPQYARLAALILLSGVAISLFLLVLEIAKLATYYRGGKRSDEEGWTIIETGKEHPPFSCLDILFVSSRDNYNIDEWRMILTHEKQHSVELHVVDMFLIQLSRVVFWFNPLVYMYGSRLLLVHEYQADRASAENPQEYGRFLIEQAVLQAAPSVSHSFNSSPIKNRIGMLTRKAASRTGKANLKLLIVLPLTIFSLLFFAKNSYSENKTKPAAAEWRKQVARVIDIRKKDDTIMHHLRDVSPDATLLEMLVNEIKAGKITAYANREPTFSSKLSASALAQMMAPQNDTFILTDPVDRKETTKIVRKDFNYEDVHKYRILEEWVYDPGTGKTAIEITGIAPVRNIYGDDGVFHGHQAMFYLRYSDVKNIIAHYELYHPDNTLAGHIWDDYFNSGEEKTVKE